jgi:hypothetical protein
MQNEMFRNPFPSSYIVGPKKEDVLRGWRKLFTEELHNLHPLSVIVAPKEEEKTLDWRIFFV